jgi:hypothetical protein
MSREVRRVPVDWKHPTEPDVYGWTIRQPAPSKILRPGERFISLYGDSFTPAHDEWERERAQWEAGTHEHLAFLVQYYSAEGFLNRNGERDEPRRYKVYGDDGETVIREFHPSTTAEVLAVYPYSDYDNEPTPQTHMPDFSTPADNLGWCLYETVSEGTPTTPVFATAEELINHLATVGEDYDQKPYRREAAERLVRSGSSMGSMVMAGGVLYDGAKDIDRIPGGAS